MLILVEVILEYLFAINERWTEKWDSSKPSYYNDTNETDINQDNILNFIDNENNEH